MRTHRKRGHAGILLALCLTLVAAAVSPGALAAERPDEAAAALPPAGEWPMTVRDYEGRTVTIRWQPRRIVSLAPSNTEILFALGLQEYIVGVDTFSDYPWGARLLPRVGDLFNPNVEKMFAARPDLVLAIGGSQKMWEKLEADGVPVVVIQPATFQEVTESIELIGRITGADAAARDLAENMRARWYALAYRIMQVDWRPRVFWEVWYDPLMSAGPGSFMDDLINLAGGQNVAADTGTAWPEVSLEAMLARDPEVIITTDPDWAAQVESGKLRAWAGTTAVRHRRVYVVTDDLVSRPGPRMIDGLEQVASAIHPVLFWFR